MATVLQCVDDLRNWFSRSQHFLEPAFKEYTTIRGAWEGTIRNGGNFPVGTGGRARVTTLGSERMAPADMVWTPLIGLQDDCVVSCNVPLREVPIGNADHKWYGVFVHGQYTTPFCLESMWLDALNLPAQIRNRLMNLKRRSVDVMDEFFRMHQIQFSDHKWMGVDDGTNSGTIREGLWRFELDANGQPNVNKIILIGVEPENVALPSISIFNWIREFGSYEGAFPLEGNIPIYTDFETATELPKFDTNVRMDNRYRQPGALDPSLTGVDAYAGYRFNRDPFMFRYYWDTEDENYPDGVLTRINHWTNREVSENCVSAASADYLNADFTLQVPFSNMVWEWQNYETPNPPDMPYEQPDSPYNGMWRFVNEVNEITPCNSQRNLAYWQMILKKAAKPDMTNLGHVVLTRRFNSRGVFKSCKALTVPVGGTYDCTPVCPPIDAFPPAYATREVCGMWNEAGATCGS